MPSVWMPGISRPKSARASSTGHCSRHGLQAPESMATSETTSCRTAIAARRVIPDDQPAGLSGGLKPETLRRLYPTSAMYAEPESSETRHPASLGRLQGSDLTDLGKRLYARRKETVERSFADAKELHGHRYARFRGLAQGSACSRRPVRNEEDGPAAGQEGRLFMAQNLRESPVCRPIRTLPLADLASHSNFQNPPRFGLSSENRFISK